MNRAIVAKELLKVARELTAGPYIDMYRKIKKKVGQSSILLVEMGDFYEAFDDDAIVVSEVVGVPLTKRQGVPMAGFVRRSIRSAIKALKSGGYKVMIADDFAEHSGLAKSISLRRAAEGDKCGPSGCIKKVKDGWGVMSGKTGKMWPQTFKSEVDAEDALKRYHGWGFKK